MTYRGTARYADLPPGEVPPLVLAAVEVARQQGFELCVHPATGRLLAALASGVGDGVVGETGTGTGAGVAWMLSTASPETRIVSIEIDERRATATAELFAAHPNVTILHGEANDLADHGPFDLLVIDSGAHEEGPLHRSRLDPATVLAPGGLIFKDDLWPMDRWPPLDFHGEVDELRVRLFEHPDLLTTEVTVAEGFAVQLARRRPA
ncbi:MAG: O-methyltransferase [Acidimicrobiia bacterium]